MNLPLIIALAVVAGVVLLAVLGATYYFLSRRARKADDDAEERTIAGIKSIHSHHSQETVVSGFMGVMEKEKSSSEEPVTAPEAAALKGHVPSSRQARTPSPTTSRRVQQTPKRTTHSRPPQFKSASRRHSTGSSTPPRSSWQSPILPSPNVVPVAPPPRAKRRETRSVVLQTIAEHPSVYTHYRDP